tara:strand:- start:12531 stop:12707 length:177 start_codon:yes stop_codon:yes gene_type:complete
MNGWKEAVNQEFIDNLIDELERLKYNYKVYGGGEEYYQEVGRIVCAEIQATYDKDVEL